MLKKPNDLEVLARAIEQLRSQVRKRLLSQEGRRILLEIVKKLEEMGERRIEQRVLH
jgi:hypothetical protein